MKLVNSFFTFPVTGDLNQRSDTPQASTVSLLSVDSAPVSPSKSLPNVNSSPALVASNNSRPGSGASTPKAPPPSIHLTASPNMNKASNNGNVNAASIKKKNSLTSSLTNMMAQLSSAGATGGATSPTSEEDLLSVKSDDSDADSDCFVVINQVFLKKSEKTFDELDRKFFPE